MRLFRAIICFVIFLISALAYFNIIPSTPAGKVAATIFAIVGGLLTIWNLFSEGHNTMRFPVTMTTGEQSYIIDDN